MKKDHPRKSHQKQNQHSLFSSAEKKGKGKKDDDGWNSNDDAAKVIEIYKYQVWW